MIDSIGMWNAITVDALAKKTSVDVKSLWKIIEAQSQVEAEANLASQKLIQEMREHKKLQSGR